MNAMLPDYAAPILAARKAGKKPADAIVVAIRCDARSRCTNPQVVIPEHPVVHKPVNPYRYDWLFASHLDAIVAFMPRDAMLVPYVCDCLWRVGRSVDAWDLQSGKQFPVSPLRHVARRQMRQMYPDQAALLDEARHATH